MPGPKVVDAFLARQAVFDRSLSVFGYELYFRSGTENAFTATDGDRASAQVIESCLNTFGLGRLTVGRRVFVNCSEKMLTQGLVTLLPPQHTVLEILTPRSSSAAVVSAVKALKRKGYLIALDDFTAEGASSPLTALADILKVDFQAVPAEERRSIARTHVRPGLSLLAKKVGMRPELTEAMESGYSLYQGFFFCRPEVVGRKEIPAHKITYFRFLREVNRPDADFSTLEQLIRQDVALSLKLLRYINSATVGVRSRVDSIKQALTLLGLDMVRQWVSLLTLAVMSEDKPQELVVTSLVRARFCEQVALAAGQRGAQFELFMVGMLSVIDAILDRPMLEIVSELPMSDEAKGALMGEPGGMGRILGLAMAYEHAEWDRLPVLAEKLTLDLLQLPDLYREAVAWADQIFQLSSSGA